MHVPFTGLPEVPVENVSKRNASPRLRNQRDRIREQENAVLNIFSQESFFKVLHYSLFEKLRI